MDDPSPLAGLLARHGFRQFLLSRTEVGHLTLVAQVEGRGVDVVLDTGAGSTFLELDYCRSLGIGVTDTGRPAGNGGNVYKLGDIRFSLDGLPIRTNGIFAIDLTQTNQRLVAKGADPVRAVIGQDVLRHHQAVIDYSTLVLFLKEQPVPIDG